jgi:hypothetical protein
MSITSPARDRRSIAARLALVSTVSLGLVAGPIAVAAPAMADYVSNRDCKVKAVKPHPYTHYGHKYVNFKIRIDCEKDRKVQVRQQLWEQDYGRDRDDRLDDRRRFEKWVDKDYDVVIDSKHRLRNTEARGDRHEEVYHMVSYRVKDGNGWTQWSDWHVSKVVSVRR